MTAFAVAAVLIAVVVAGTLLRLAGLRPEPAPELLAERTLSKVVVTLKSGTAFGGVIFDLDERSLLMRDAVALTVGADRESPVPVDGELFVARTDVEWVQVP